MKRLLFLRKKLFAAVMVAVAFAFIALPVHPVHAFEQRPSPRILNLNIDKTFGNQVAYILKTTGPLNLPKYPFTLSEPNRIVLDFHGALPGNQLKSACQKASSPEIEIRSGYHKYYTRIVFDFGDKRLPTYRLSQKLGFVTISFETQTAVTIKGEDVKSAPLEGALGSSDNYVNDIKDNAESEGNLDSDEEPLFEEDSSNRGGDAQDSGKEDDSLFDEEDALSGEGGNPKSAFYFSGVVKNKYFHDTNEDDVFESDALNHFETVATLAYDNQGIFSAKLGVDVDSYTDENQGDWNWDNDIRLHEAYINLSFSALNLRLGNQIVRWGKSDGNSPIDNVNPEDLRGGIAGRREERKIPLPMANVVYNLRGTTFQGIYMPGFYKSDFDIVGTDWSLFGHSDQSVGSFNYQEEDHDDPFDSPEFGLRISSTVRNFDFALSYLFTRTDTPVIGSLVVPLGFPLDLENGSIRDIVPFAIATNQIIPIKYERQTIYGFEFETTISNFGVRGDVAYFSEANYLTNDLDQIQKPMVNYVLGADYVSSSDFYINLQFSHAFILDYEDTIAYQKENVYAVNGTISQEFMNGELKLALRGYHDLSGDASMYNPYLIIKPWDNLTLEIGAEIFSGSKQTTLGLFEDNDQYYGMAKFEF